MYDVGQQKVVTGYHPGADYFRSWKLQLQIFPDGFGSGESKRKFELDSSMRCWVLKFEKKSYQHD